MIFTCKQCWYEGDGDLMECPVCGSRTYNLSFRKKDKYDGVNLSCTMDNHERVSEVLGVHPKQIEQARKIHPDAEFTKDGGMIIHNRHEKKRRLKERTQFYRRHGSDISFVEYE